MDKRHLEELIAIEDSYWWHIAKRRLVCELLRKRFPPPGPLLEAGIGGAGNLLEFRRLGYDVAGVDLIPESVRHCNDIGLKATVHDISQPWPFEPGSARVVAMLDVLEHIEDAPLALKNACAVLQPDGGIVFTVPAFPSLMGPWDEMLGHFRRYNTSLLHEHARQAGLRVAWLSHWNAFSLPPALVIRNLEKILKRQRGAEFPRVSPFMNRFLLACAGGERWVMQRCPLPLGLSLVGVLVR